MREGMSEAEILPLVLEEATKCGATIFRNNRGTFYGYNAVKRLIGLVLSGKTGAAQALLRDKRNGLQPTKAGLGIAGSSDLIGWTADGKFLAIEVKATKGKETEEQIRFLDAVNKAGGVGFVARSLDDVRHNLCG